MWTLTGEAGPGPGSLWSQDVLLSRAREVCGRGDKTLLSGTVGLLLDF